MDNNDEKENKQEERPDLGNGSSNEDIPRWLQGFEDSEPDDTKPITPEEISHDAWVREIHETSIEPLEETDLEAPSSTENSEFEGFDELDLELAGDTGRQAGLEEETGEQIPAENEIVEPPEESLGDEEIEIEDFLEEELPSPEGFFDISELDITASVEGVEAILEDEPLRQGDLPEWLQEMINETEEPQPDIIAPAAFQELNLPDEPKESTTPPTDLESEPLQQEFIPEEEQKDLAMPEPEPDSKSAFSIIDEETSPLPISIVDEEGPTLPEEKPLLEDTSLDEQEALLDRVKQYLDQRNFAEVLPMIRTMVEESTQVEELEEILEKTAEADEESNSQIMEILGDIALKQNKPEVAFDAYAKAIKYLLVNNEALDEIG